MNLSLPLLLLAGTSAAVATIPLTTQRQEEFLGLWRFTQLALPADLRLSYVPEFTGPDEYRAYSLEGGDQFTASTGISTIYDGGSLIDVPDSSGTMTLPAVLEPRGRYLVDNRIPIWPNNTLDVAVAGHRESVSTRYEFLTLVRPKLGGTTANLAGDWRVCTLQIPNEPSVRSIISIPPEIRYELRRGSSDFFRSVSGDLSIDAAGNILSGGTPSGETIELDAAGQITGSGNSFILCQGGDYFAGVNPATEETSDDSWRLAVAIRRPATLSFADLEGEWAACGIQIPDSLPFFEDTLPNVYFNYVLANAEELSIGISHLSFDAAGHLDITSPDGNRDSANAALSANPGDIIIEDGSGGFLLAHINSRKNVMIAAIDNSDGHELVVAVKRAPILCAPDWGDVRFTRTSSSSVSVLIPDDGTMLFELEGSPDLVTWSPLTTSKIPLNPSEILLAHTSPGPLPDHYFVRVLSRVRRDP